MSLSAIPAAVPTLEPKSSHLKARTDTLLEVYKGSKPSAIALRKLVVELEQTSPKLVEFLAASIRTPDAKRKARQLVGSTIVSALKSSSDRPGRITAITNLSQHFKGNDIPKLFVPLLKRIASIPRGDECIGALSDSLELLAPPKQKIILDLILKKLPHRSDAIAHSLTRLRDGFTIITNPDGRVDALTYALSQGTEGSADRALRTLLDRVPLSMFAPTIGGLSQFSSLTIGAPQLRLIQKVTESLETLLGNKPLSSTAAFADLIYAIVGVSQIKGVDYQGIIDAFTEELTRLQDRSLTAEERCISLTDDFTRLTIFLESLVEGGSAELFSEGITKHTLAALARGEESLAGALDRLEPMAFPPTTATLVQTVLPVLACLRRVRDEEPPYKLYGHDLKTLLEKGEEFLANIDDPEAQRWATGVNTGITPLFQGYDKIPSEKQLSEVFENLSTIIKRSSTEDGYAPFGVDEHDLWKRLGWSSIRALEILAQRPSMDFEIVKGSFRQFYTTLERRTGKRIPLDLRQDRRAKDLYLDALRNGVVDPWKLGTLYPVVINRLGLEPTNAQVRKEFTKTVATLNSIIPSIDLKSVYHEVYANLLGDGTVPEKFFDLISLEQRPNDSELVSLQRVIEWVISPRIKSPVNNHITPEQLTAIKSLGSILVRFPAERGSSVSGLVLAAPVEAPHYIAALPRVYSRAETQLSLRACELIATAPEIILKGTSNESAITEQLNIIREAQKLPIMSGENDRYIPKIIRAIGTHTAPEYESREAWIEDIEWLIERKDISPELFDFTINKIESTKKNLDISPAEAVLLIKKWEESFSSFPRELVVTLLNDAGQSLLSLSSSERFQLLHTIPENLSELSILEFVAWLKDRSVKEKTKLADDSNGLRQPMIECVTFPVASSPTVADFWRVSKAFGRYSDAPLIPSSALGEVTTTILKGSSTISKVGDTTSIRLTTNPWIISQPATTDFCRGLLLSLKKMEKAKDPKEDIRIRSAQWLSRAMVYQTDLFADSETAAETVRDQLGDLSSFAKAKGSRSREKLIEGIVKLSRVWSEGKVSLDVLKNLSPSEILTLLDEHCLVLFPNEQSLRLEIATEIVDEVIKRTPRKRESGFSTFAKVLNPTDAQRGDLLLELEKLAAGRRRKEPPPPITSNLSPSSEPSNKFAARYGQSVDTPDPAALLRARLPQRPSTTNESVPIGAVEALEMARNCIFLIAQNAKTSIEVSQAVIKALPLLLPNISEADFTPAASKLVEIELAGILNPNRSSAVVQHAGFPLKKDTRPKKVYKSLDEVQEYLRRELKLPTTIIHDRTKPLKNVLTGDAKEKTAEIVYEVLYRASKDASSIQEIVESGAIQLMAYPKLMSLYLHDFLRPLFAEQFPQAHALLVQGEHYPLWSTNKTVARSLLMFATNFLPHLFDAVGIERVAHDETDHVLATTDGLVTVCRAELQRIKNVLGDPIVLNAEVFEVTGTLKAVILEQFVKNPHQSTKTFIITAAPHNAGIGVAIFDRGKVTVRFSPGIEEALTKEMTTKTARQIQSVILKSRAVD